MSSEGKECQMNLQRRFVQGNYDPLLAGSRRKESAEQAAARLKEEEALARSAVV